MKDKTNKMKETAEEWDEQAMDLIHGVETPKENEQVELEEHYKDGVLTKVKANGITIYPKENWKTEIVKKFFVYNLVTQTPAGAEKELLEYIDTLLLTQRQERDKEILEMIDKQRPSHVQKTFGDLTNKKETYIRLDKKLSDLSERIEKRGDNKWL